MSSLRKITKKLGTLGVRFMSERKRKYPVNPELANQLPGMHNFHKKGTKHDLNYSFSVCCQ